ncbi:hypothetical protein [Parasphingorhabdus pacifica]
MTRVRCLPMAWHFVRVSQAESYTFRWGRGAGFLTVHTGDQRAKHTDDGLVATVRGVGDWRGREDLAAQAARWLRSANAGRAAGR